uniref:Mitochondrial genome maintenance exonuclease 1 n=1 Tax=Callorhinchus milii TaxID=7868 RepID=V9KVW4_CALMI
MHYFGFLNTAICRGLRKPFKQHWRLLPENLIYSSHYFSTSCSFNNRKRNLSQYEQVDQQKYASLVRSVVSAKTSPQTPETLFGEDDLLYGPVIKSKPPTDDSKAEIPKMSAPLNTGHSAGLTQETALKQPLQIALKRVHSKASLPSVTRVLQLTMSLEQAFYLERWKRRMITELGEEGFKEYNNNLLNQGKLFHAALEVALQSAETPKSDSEKIAGYLQSVEHVLKDVRRVQVLESAVHHQPLQYVGMVDCVADFRGKLCVIDWKTSEKPKPYLRNTFDNPIQVAAYTGALNHDNNYDFQVQHGLIVIAYKDGSPAHPHFMDSDLCLKYWQKWLLRLKKYKEKISNTL